MNKITNVSEALSVLVQATELSIKAGVFTMQESKLITDAIEFLIPNYFNKEESEKTEEVK